MRIPLRIWSALQVKELSDSHSNCWLNAYVAGLAISNLPKGQSSRLLMQLKGERGKTDLNIEWNVINESIHFSVWVDYDFFSCRLSVRKRQRSRREVKKEKRGSSESSSEEERWILHHKILLTMGRWQKETGNVRILKKTGRGGGGGGLPKSHFHFHCV